MWSLCIEPLSVRPNWWSWPRCFICMQIIACKDHFILFVVYSDSGRLPRLVLLFGRIWQIFHKQFPDDMPFFGIAAPVPSVCLWLVFLWAKLSWVRHEMPNALILLEFPWNCDITCETQLIRTSCCLIVLQVACLEEILPQIRQLAWLWLLHWYDHSGQWPHDR